MFQLGRRPPSNKPVLALGDFLTAPKTAPKHPGKVDNLRGWAYGMYGNDQFGVCGPTSVANSRILLTGDLNGGVAAPTQDAVYDLYRRSGNPNFSPLTGADDNGVDMKTMLSQVVQGGIGDVKAIAFASVDVKKLAQVRAAIDIFGFLLLGVDLETAQQGQTHAGLWDYAPTGEWGGHAVLGGQYTSSRKVGTPDVEVISWAQKVGLTNRFWTHQTEEAYVLIWPEHLGTAKFDQHFDLIKLRSAFQAITGRTLAA